MARLPILLRNGSATFIGVLGAKNGLLRVSHVYNDISTTCRTCFVGRSLRGSVNFNQAGSRRQLSSSSALTNKDRNDGELFTAAPTFEPEYSSSGIDASVTDVLAQTATEDFAALGLGGYTPPGLIQSALEFLHVNAHLPWWASIAAATITLRLLLFPLAVRMQRDAAKMANISPITKKVQERIDAYKRIGNRLAAADESVKLLSIQRQHGINPFAGLVMIGCVQFPMFVSFFMAIRGMTYLPLESMKTGGLYWFTDLTVPDPTYTLSLMACLAFLSNVELGGEGGTPSNEMHDTIKRIMRVSAFAIIPISISFPSGVLVYWVTNSLYSTCQILVLKIPLVKRLLGIPKIETPPEDKS